MLHCNTDHPVVQIVINKMRTTLALATDNILVISRYCTHQLLSTYVFEICLGIICIAGGKNGKENMESLKTVQLSTVVVTLLYSTLLNNLPAYSSILLDFLVFYS